MHKQLKFNYWGRLREISTADYNSLKRAISLHSRDSHAYAKEKKRAESLFYYYGAPGGWNPRLTAIYYVAIALLAAFILFDKWMVFSISFVILSMLVYVVSSPSARSATYSRYLWLKFLRSKGARRQEIIAEVLSMHLKFFENGAAESNSFGKFIKFARHLRFFKSATRTVAKWAYIESLAFLAIGYYLQNVLFLELFVIVALSTAIAMIVSSLIIPYAEGIRDSKVPLLVHDEDILAIFASEDEQEENLPAFL
ncbi:MAG: hypothetical protein OK457_07385 [Thaumarchaeota archaeon]|nr:hypothetical protein [Nitrososphaerota archaeon]